jgi:serine/threonine protein kinase
MAPELIEHKLGGRFTDWWAYGILAHELLTGSTPWSSLTDSRLIKWEIVHKIVLPPSYLSKQATKFLGCLLRHQVNKRLGTKADDEIRKSSFFTDVNWEAMARLECAPAFVPSAINVNKEDQDEAMEGYRQVMSESDKPCSNMWSIGLEGHTKFLFC